MGLNDLLFLFQSHKLKKLNFQMPEAMILIIVSIITMS